jgi:hypothetical protein
MMEAQALMEEVQGILDGDVQSTKTSDFVEATKEDPSDVAYGLLKTHSKLKALLMKEVDKVDKAWARAYQEAKGHERIGGAALAAADLLQPDKSPVRSLVDMQRFLTRVIDHAREVAREAYRGRGSMGFHRESSVGDTEQDGPEQLDDLSLDEAFGRRRGGYGGDPYWMTAKRPGKAKDGTSIKKGDKILWWPSTKTAMVGKKAEQAWREFLSQKGDEEGMPYASHADLPDEPELSETTRRGLSGDLEEARSGFGSPSRTKAAAKMLKRALKSDGQDLDLAQLRLAYEYASYKGGPVAKKLKAMYDAALKAKGRGRDVASAFGEEQDLLGDDLDAVEDLGLDEAGFRNAKVKEAYMRALTQAGVYRKGMSDKEMIQTAKKSDKAMALLKNAGINVGWGMMWDKVAEATDLDLDEAYSDIGRDAPYTGSDTSMQGRAPSTPQDTKTAKMRVPEKAVKTVVGGIEKSKAAGSYDLNVVGTGKDYVMVSGTEGHLVQFARHVASRSATPTIVKTEFGSGGLLAKEEMDISFPDDIDLTEGDVLRAAIYEATYYHDGKDYYVDTAFMNALTGKMKGCEMSHMGFGEFTLKCGKEGEVEFDRMRGKDFPGQSGRSHKVYDNKGGKLLKKMMSAMKGKAKASKAESLDEYERYLQKLDEAIKFVGGDKPVPHSKAKDTDPPIIAALRKIVRERQAAKVQGKTIDMSSANIVIQVYDALNSTNQKKMAGMKVGPMVNLAWKLAA